MTERPLIIGVAGGTGSGKTTLVSAIVNAIDSRHVATIQHDCYYKDRGHLSRFEREKINYDHPDAYETDLLIRHLTDLSENRAVRVPVYDFSTHSRQPQYLEAGPAKAVVVEGILIFADKGLREMLDIKIFVDTAADIRFIRRLKRDLKERGRSVESVIDQYMESVRPMHSEFVEASRKYSDIIVPDGHNPVAVDMVVEVIRKRLLKHIA